MEGFEKKKKNTGNVTLRKLKELSIWGLHRLTARSLSGFPIPALRSLSIEGCVGLDDFAIEELCNSASSRSLLSLNVKYCHRLSDRAVETIASRLSRLQHLSLCYVFRVTDIALQAISKSLSDLRSLDVSHCLKITDLGISKIVDNLLELSELRLCSCKQFTSETVESFAKSLHRRKGEFSLSLLDLRDVNLGAAGLALAALRSLDESFVESGNGCFVR